MLERVSAKLPIVAIYWQMYESTTLRWHGIGKRAWSNDIEYKKGGKRGWKRGFVSPATSLNSCSLWRGPRIEWSGQLSRIHSTLFIAQQRRNIELPPCAWVVAARRMFKAKKQNRIDLTSEWHPSATVHLLQHATRYVCYIFWVEHQPNLYVVN